MAVISAEQLHDSWEGEWDNLWQRTYTLTFRLVTNNRGDGPVVLRNTRTGGGDLLLPLIGTSYFVNADEKDLGSFASRATYRCEGFAGSGLSWIVTYFYGPYNGALFGPDPAAWPARVTFSSQKYERVVLIDQDGNPILNSALCPFSEPVTVDDSRSAITVMRNELIGGGTVNGTMVPAFDFTKAETFRDSVNMNMWNFFPQKQAKCSSITTGESQYDSNNQRWYFETSYFFEINRDTWTKKLLDQGYQKLVSGVPTPITNNGQTVDDPVLLDGSGSPLGSGLDPVYITAEAYKVLDFSALNIDFTQVLGTAGFS